MSDTTTIGYSGAKTTYTVATAGQYYIVAYGAQGGSDSNCAGGLGAEIGGTFTLTAGEVLTVAVGGGDVTKGNPAGGGGAGYRTNGDPGQTGMSGSSYQGRGGTSGAGGVAGNGPSENGGLWRLPPSPFAVRHQTPSNEAPRHSLQLRNVRRSATHNR